MSGSGGRTNIRSMIFTLAFLVSSSKSSTNDSELLLLSFFMFVLNFTEGLGLVGGGGARPL